MRSSVCGSFPIGMGIQLQSVARFAAVIMAALLVLFASNYNLGANPTNDQQQFLGIVPIPNK